MSLHQFSEAMGNAVDAKNQNTYQHSQHVAVISYLLALAVGFRPAQADVIHIAGHLHDIGKIAVPDAVLLKQGKLTENEWLTMRKHPESGAKIVDNIKLFNHPGGIKDMILCHHEKFDGSGYPNQLSGNQIPIGARIIAVADALSAMIQVRIYRPGRSFAEAINEILKNSGSQFDPVIVVALEGQAATIKSWLDHM